MVTTNMHTPLKGWIAFLMLASVSFSCSKTDEYDKYTAEGETVYPGKLESVVAYSGKERVRITGSLNADPRIATVKVFWNDQKDSLVFPVKRSSSGNMFDEIIPIEESITTFTIYTYDVDGNRSVPVTVTGKSFGDNYRRKISNRIISYIRYLSTGTTIAWEPIDPLTGAISTEIKYTVNGQTKTLITPASAETSVLDAFENTNTPVSFRTEFRPEANSIDTFMVNYRDTVLIPLKNSRVPFIASAVSGRWGILADWQSNDAVKNHGGFGGWDEWNSNIFNVESGWGSPAVTNGKIWQTFNLAPGNYVFEISDLRDTNLSSADNAYLVAAEGNGLPDVSGVATALGNVHIVSDKPLSDLKVHFTVSTQADISVGFLTTQPDGTPGRYCNIRAFNLYTSN